MSFSSEQKTHIIEKACKSACCRRALLLGVMFAKARNDGTLVKISIEKNDSCVYLSRLIREFYGVQAQIDRDTNGGRRYIISFESKSAAEYISNIEKNSNLIKSKCDSCFGAFLRGVFLAAGRASDPKKNYAIHFSLGERSDIFAGFLADRGFTPSLTGVGGGRVIYLASNTAVEDFFGIAGMNNAYFAVAEAKMEAQIRSKVARAANCEMSNIQRAVDAAGRQYDLILKLEKANLLSSLPDDLEATARLRLMHKDMSLSRLATISNPHISKPGLAHRMKKIMEIGEQMLCDIESKKG